MGGRRDERYVGGASSGAAAARRRRVGGRASLDALDASAYDPWVSCLSPTHIGGLLVLLRGVLTGSRIIVQERFEPGALLAHAPAGAHVSLVPAMLERLVRGAPDLSGLGAIVVGGGALDPALRDAAQRLGGRIVSTYGSTESCGGVVYDGVAFAGTRVRIAADKPDAIGGIEVAGPTLMDGYRADHAATAEAFATDGWLRTGDLGWVDERGAAAVCAAARTMRSAPVARPCGPKRWRRSFERTRRLPTSRSRGAPIRSGARTWSRGSSHAIPRTHRAWSSFASTVATHWRGSRRRATSGW